MGSHLLVQIIAGLAGYVGLGQEGRTLILAPRVKYDLFTSVDKVKEIPLLLIEKVLNVDAACVASVLNQLDFVGAALAGERDRNLLYVHGEIVELEALIENTAQLPHLAHFDCEIVGQTLELVRGRVDERLGALFLNNLQFVAYLLLQVAYRILNVELRRPEQIRIIFQKVYIVYNIFNVDQIVSD